MICFYILGDMGSGEIYQLQVAIAMNEHIKKNKKKKVFICGLGDNIYEEGCRSINDKQFINKFEIPYKMIPNNIKFYMSIGNHDYGTSYGKGNSLSQIRYGRRSEKENGKWILPSNYYDYQKKDKGNIVHFFVIDTNMDNLSDKEKKKQLRDMKRKIDKSNADWKIVYGHHTWKSVGGHGNANEELNNFLETLYHKTPFDLYMCGHEHNKQLINMKIDESILPLVVCGTGGKMYSEYINYENLNKTDQLEFLSNNLGYAFVQTSKRIMELYFFDENNNQEFYYKIKKI
tara:strand:+ start:3914 stop:4777 length:864 start_codon:yes stop_codon:yes gene_type:complete